MAWKTQNRGGTRRAIGKVSRLIITLAGAPIALLLAGMLSPALLAPIDVSIWLVIKTILLYPLFEEYLFRAFAHTKLLERSWFRRSFMGISIASFCIAIAFTLLHLIVRQEITLLWVFFPALIIGWHFEDFNGNWKIALILHAWFNAIWIVAIAVS